MASTTLPEPTDKTDINALRAPIWAAIAEAVQGGLPAPFQVSLHYSDHSNEIMVQLRMRNNGPEDVDAWARLVDGGTYWSDVFKETSRPSWRSYRAGDFGVRWQGWRFDVWSAVDEPESDQS